MSVDAYIGVGANIDADHGIPTALQLLSLQSKVTGVSIFYRSKALGRPEQPMFTNGVFRVSWAGAAKDLKFECLRQIEDQLGRRRGADRYADRPIDLDILVFGDAEINCDGLTVPDPDIMQRPFIYIPLLELAPDICLPGIGELQARLSGSLLPFSSGLLPAVGLTETLRGMWRKNMGRRCFNDPD